MNIKKWYFIAPFALSFLLLVLGTFFDLSIAEAVFIGRTTVTRVFAGIMPFLPYLLLVLCAGILIRIAYTMEKSFLRIFLFICSIGEVMVGAYMAHHEFVSESGFPNLDLIVSVCIVITLTALVFLAGYFIGKQIKDPNLWKELFSLLIIAAFSIGIAFLLKYVFNRPRFIILKNEEGGLSLKDYLPWYQPFNKETVPGLIKDAFESFPSGHTVCMTFGAFFISFIFSIFEKTAKYKNIAFIGGYLLALLMASSRMTSGNHFLSDISMSLLFPFIGAVIAYIFRPILIRWLAKKE